MTGVAETTEIDTGDLRALFDLAVNSLDFGSGFWDREDTEVARRVAVLLGVDPMVATPSLDRRNYPHGFVAYGEPTPYQLGRCQVCLDRSDHPKSATERGDDPVTGQ